MDFLKRMSCWVLVGLGLVSFQQKAEAQACLQAQCDVYFDAQFACYDPNNVLLRICADDVEAGNGDIDHTTGAPIPGTGDYASENQCPGADGSNIATLQVRPLRSADGVTFTQIAASADANQSNEFTSGYRPCFYLNQSHLTNYPGGIYVELLVTGTMGVTKRCTTYVTYRPPSCQDAGPVASFATCPTFDEPIDCTENPLAEMQTAEPTISTSNTCYYTYTLQNYATEMVPNDDNSTGAHCFTMVRKWRIAYECKWDNDTVIDGYIGDCVQTLEIQDNTSPEIMVGSTLHNDQAVETYAVVQNHTNDCFVGEPEMMYNNIYDLNWNDACGRRLRTYDECDFDVLLMFVRELNYNETITTNGTSCVRTYTNTFINDPRQDNYYCYTRIFAYVAVDNCGNESEDTLYIVQNVEDTQAPVLTTSDEIDGTTTINSCDIFAEATISVTVNAPTDNCAASKYLAIFITVYDADGNVIQTLPSQYAQGTLTVSVAVPGSADCELYTIVATAKDPCLNTSEELVFTREVCNPNEGPIAKCDNVQVTLTNDVNGVLVGSVEAVDIDEGSDDYCTLYGQHPYLDGYDYTFWWGLPSYCSETFDEDDFNGCLGFVGDFDPFGPEPYTGIYAEDVLNGLGISDNTLVYTNYNSIVVQISRSATGPWSNQLQFNETTDCPGPVTVYLRAINLLGEVSVCSSQITFTNCPAARNTGRIANENNAGLRGVTVNFDNGASIVTDADGKYEYSGNVTSVTPYNNSNPRNGLSGADLYDIRRHILDIAPLNSGYKMMAADANNNGSITGADLTALANLLVGNTSSLPNNTSWRYVAGSYAMSTSNWASAPASAPAGSNVNFYGVKVGDVNMSANLAQRFSGLLEFNVEDKALKAGDIVEVPFNAADFRNMTSYQMTLEFAGLAYKGIKGGAVEAAAINADQAGKLAMVWFGDKATTVADNDAVFTLVFEATEATSLSKALSVGGSITAPEASDASGSLKNIALRFNGANAGFALLQNVPNPFQGLTTVQFTLPENGKATLTVFDVAGRAVKTVNGNFAKGFNQVEFNSNELPAGVLYYQLTAGNFSATKKMIVLD